MDVNTDLAMWSNQLIISAMIVYAVAMIFYAFDLFGTRELKTSETEVASSAKASTVRRTNRKTAIDRRPRPAGRRRLRCGEVIWKEQAPRSPHRHLRCSCSPSSSTSAECSPVPCPCPACRGAT
jgi:hypothetical protein